MSKYHARKVVSPDGEEFDSRLEMKRWYFLKQVEEEGRIRNLQRQEYYELVPEQRYPKVIHLKTKDKVDVRLGEHAVGYIADFSYELWYDGMVSYDDINPFCCYTDRGDAIPLHVVYRADETPVELSRFLGWIPVVEDTKGMKTKDYIIKRKLMRYIKDIVVREVKKPFEEV